MTVKVIPQQEQHLLTDWDSARAYLNLPTETTRNLYIGPNNLRWDLSGRRKGRQGARLSTHMQGDYHLPIDQLFTEGAYQVGATYERTNIQKRLINLGVTLGGRVNGQDCSELQYRAIESNWWDSWPPDTPGWWGRYVPFSGWRWTQVQLAKTVDTAQPLDPTAFGNNVFQWDMQIVAAKPWWAKRLLTDSWTAAADSIALLGYDEQTFTIANRGTLEAWPKIQYSGPGQCWVQDGDTMIPLPVLSDQDGYVTVDTDPSARTFTSSQDPVDNPFYVFLRQSGLAKLDVDLQNLGNEGLPVWRRGNGVRFQYSVPPRTVANIKVRHTQPGAQVSILMPQRFGRPS